MYVNTQGVVIRETKVGDSDKILTVLTEDFGKISISARGVRKSGSKFGGARFLCYSRFTLFKSPKGYSINECDLIKGFYNVSLNIESLSLASYCAELACIASSEKVKDPVLLSLVLNTLYAIDTNKLPLKLIKAVFELRISTILGYHPDFSSCYLCGGDAAYLAEDGRCVCSECKDGEDYEKSALKAAKYIVSAPSKSIFSFKCSDEVSDLLYAASEGYLMNYVEFAPKSLPLLKDLFT